MTTRILWPNGGRNNGVLMYWCRADLFRRRVCWHSSICWPVNIACLDEKHEFKELLDAINAVKESKAPGRCGIPAEIWKHTWRYETRHLDFLRREKFCSKAWFKQEHTTANFRCAQGTFYLTSSSPLRRGIKWSLQGAPDPQLFSLGLWLVSDVQWTQSCYWVDKLLAPYTHLHNAYLSILMRKNYHRPIEAFWSTTNTTSPTFRLSVASLHFIWVLRVARNSSLQCPQNSFTR